MASRLQITSRQNPHLRRLRAAAAGNLRLSEGLIALESEHLVLEALRSRLPLPFLFVTTEHDLPPNLAPETEVLFVAPGLLSAALSTQTPQRITALLEPPTFLLAQALTPPALLLVAAGLQDPGNLGTLIRSAEAFGATGLLTLPNTVSPWNGKALRASAGSAFRLPIVPSDVSTLAALSAQGVQLLAAVAEAQGAQSLPTVDLTRPTAILIGNEGAGLPSDLLALSTHRVTIPCSGPVESLNAAVAGSILLFAAQSARSPTPRP